MEHDKPWDGGVIPGSAETTTSRTYLGCRKMTLGTSNLSQDIPDTSDRTNDKLMQLLFLQVIPTGISRLKCLPLSSNRCCLCCLFSHASAPPWPKRATCPMGLPKSRRSSSFSQRDSWSWDRSSLKCHGMSCYIMDPGRKKSSTIFRGTERENSLFLWPFSIANS